MIGGTARDRNTPNAARSVVSAAMPAWCHVACVLLAAITLLVAPPTAAWAQPADAAQLKLEGDRAMDTLRYEDALAKYQASYALKADPALLFNQGRAYEGLGRFPEALDKLVAFRTNAPKEMLARLGDALDKNIEELKGRVALVEISVDVDGATVRMGDRVLGTTPLGELRVNAGKAHFELSKDGYFAEALDVTLKGGAKNPIKISLTPRDSRATLLITSPVAGARVTVDGAARGQVPAEVRLAPGPHLIRVDQDGYQLAESSVELRALEKRSLEVPLFRRPITQEWWLWTSIGVALTGGAVGVALALTLEESPDAGTLDPGTIPVSFAPRSRAARPRGIALPADVAPREVHVLLPLLRF